MIYTIRLVQGDNIINIHHTNNIDEAVQKEKELRLEYGNESVWICDNIMEILAG
jgi:hypothetical protein